MSPWRESIVIGLAPNAVQVARLARGFKERTLERRSFEVEAAAGAGWSAPLATLESVLALSRLQGSRCRVVLSNRMVRFLLVPWHDELSSAAARARLAHAQFRAIHGAAAGAWSVRLATAAYGAPALACAIDADLMSALTGVVCAGGFDLVSVQPHAAVAFNRARRTLPQNAFWFVTLETGRLWLGRGERNGWTAIAARRIADSSAQAILAVIEQELAANAHDDAKAPVYFSGAGLAPEVVQALRGAGCTSATLETEGPLTLGVGAEASH